MSQLNPHSPIPLEDIRAAQRRIRGAVVRTPLVRLNIDHAPSEIYLKLENLQSLVTANTAEGRRPTRMPNDGTKPVLRCWHCKEVGHPRRLCKKLREERQQAGETSSH